uniref:Spherulin-1b n=1 Tax=Colletotrichum fructicola (strain Nara gc5) TaxID=1213859 RepID=L2FD12_COLFN
MHSSIILSSALFAAAALAAPAPSKTMSSAPAPNTSYSHDGPNSTDNAPPPIVPVNTRSGNQDLITKLMTAPTQQDRVKLLNQPGDFVFDFNDSGAPEGSESRGKGGFSTSATAKTFPALIGNGAAMTLGFLGPCGMPPPTSTTGPPSSTSSSRAMSVFPQGAIHQEFNPDCEDAVFVAGFNNVDPGVEQVAQTFFNLRPDVVSATLGGVQTIDGADLESFREHIPANIALGIDACLNKCGIKRNAKRDLNEIFGAAQ